MKLVEINWDPTDRQLRQFGLISLVALPLVGWLWRANAPVLWLLAGIGVLLAGLGLLAPRWLKLPFLVLSVAAIPIGLVVGELALVLIYFAVFVPIGLVFRLIGRDALELRRDSNATSYWRPKAQPRGPASYYRQS
ncbi:MAG: SxtJ family membrane protein [Planctomycetaceae bacterium]